MTITATQLKQNLGKYMEDAHDKGDIVVTRNGKPFVKLTGAKENPAPVGMRKATVEERVAAMKAIFGIIPPDITLEEAREERLSKI